MMPEETGIACASVRECHLTNSGKQPPIETRASGNFWIAAVILAALSAGVVTDWDLWQAGVRNFPESGPSTSVLDR